jgi:HSP20 family protein
MALIRWKPRTRLDPFAGLMGVREEVERMFDAMPTYGALHGGPYDTGLLEGDWAPAVDVYESDEKVVVKIELPGIEKKDVDVEILGDMLTIKGEKTKEEEKTERHYHRLERVHGSFHRSISLPGEIESDKAKASFKDGILEIELPKTEAAKPRHISIGVN